MNSTVVEDEIVEEEGKVEIASFSPVAEGPHELEYEWTLWYDILAVKPTLGSWSDNLKKLCTFSSVEDFWGVFNNISEASKLAPGSNYHLFKKGIKPEWEDPENKGGGKWTVHLDKKQAESFDQMWLYTVMACVGETFEYSEHVTGVVASIRRQNYRLAVWIKSTVNEEICLSLGRQLKEVFDVSLDLELEYQNHEDDKNKKSMYVIR